jgi:hypothetical protein
MEIINSHNRKEPLVELQQQLHTTQKTTEQPQNTNEKINQLSAILANIDINQTDKKNK